MVCFKVLIGLMCFYCASSWLDIEFFLKNVAISFFKVHYGTWMIVNLTLVVNIKHHHRNLEEQTVVFTDIKSLFFSGWVVYYGCQEKGGRHRLLTYLGFSSKPWMWSVVDVVIVHHVWVCVCSSVCSVYHHRKFLYPWSDFTWNRLRCAKIFFSKDNFDMSIRFESSL